jgi:putative Ca2+/H+ antiporter (TMEM165/GDT1 family)
VALIPLGIGAVIVARAYRDDETMQGVVMAALFVAMLAVPIGVIVGGVTHYRLKRGPTGAR